MTEQKKLVPVLVRMPRELHAAIKERARVEDRHMAGLIRLALRAYLDRKPA